MVVLLRALARLAAFLVLLALAALGLVIALVSLLPSLGPAMGLTDARDAAGSYLAQLESPGPIAAKSALYALLAALVALLLLIGALARRRQPLLILEESPEGVLAARRRAVAQVAEALTEQVRGLTATQVKVSADRTGRRGRLEVEASHPRTTDAAEVEQGAADALAPLSDGFGLTTRVRPRVGEPGQRAE